MVKEYKVAFPSGAKLNSQMFDSAIDADKFASKMPLSITMKLQDMNDTGAYSWSIEQFGLGWLLMLIVLVVLVS